MSDPSAQWVLPGQKVDLCTFTIDDINPAYVSWLNDPVTMRFSNQRFLVHDRQSCLRYLESFKTSPNLFFSIRDKQTKLSIGTMTAYLAPQHGTADMGILVGERSVWGQGFGLDAWSTLLHWLIDVQKIRKVTAGTLACNDAMLRLMDKSGMCKEGEKKLHEIVNGQPHDVLYFARFRAA